MKRILLALAASTMVSGCAATKSDLSSLSAGLGLGQTEASPARADGQPYQATVTLDGGTRTVTRLFSPAEVKRHIELCEVNGMQADQKAGEAMVVLMDFNRSHDIKSDTPQTCAAAGGKSINQKQVSGWLYRATPEDYAEAGVEPGEATPEHRQAAPEPTAPATPGQTPGIWHPSQYYSFTH